MSYDIIQQDILLDYIKEYRRITSVLLSNINKNVETNDECKTIFSEFENIAMLVESEYNYEYVGYEPIFNEYNKYRKYISEIMARLKNAGNNICDRIYNECYTSYIYHYYYLGNDV